MRISEIVAAFNRVQQLAGDVPIVLKHAEQDIATEIRKLVVSIDPQSGESAGTVEIVHGEPEAHELEPAASEATAPDA